MKKIAVLLCGSGYLDGSEIRESVGALLALSRLNARVQCFALDENQFHTMNALSSTVATDETRNQLVESARIARGEVFPLTALDETEWDGLVIPGGYGVAKSLCTYATQGIEGAVHPDVENVLRQFHAAEKPIGAICIAPVLVAMTFKGVNLELSVGSDNSSVADIEKLGHHHFNLAPNEIHIDRRHKIVSTPAYMYDSAPIHEIFEGIDLAVRSVFEMA